MVMEPVHGGMLADLPEECLPYLPGKDVSPAAWALRFVMNLPGAAVVLSGMSDLQQTEENVKTAAVEYKMSEEELSALEKISDILRRKIAVPCTGCRYCCDDCPQGLDIPSLLSLYNEHCFTGGGFLAPMALSAIPQDKWPSACIGCRSCEAVCPQQIKISEAMADFTQKLNA